MLTFRKAFICTN